jgi:hypothetical protein
MIVSLLFLIGGLVALGYIMMAKSKGKDSNGPMPGR